MDRRIFLFAGSGALLVLTAAVFAQTNTNAPIPLPARTAEVAPTATPAASPQPSPAKNTAAPLPSPQPSPSSSGLPLPTESANVGQAVDFQQNAAKANPTPTPDPLETTLSPQALGLPDVLTDQPIVPKDLISPIPKPSTNVGQNTVKTSEETLAKLRAVAKGKTPPPADKKMTIEQAVDFALRHNPDVLASIQEIRLTQGKMISVVSQVLPQLVSTSAYNYQQQSLAGPGNSSLPGASAPQNRFWNIQLGVSQLLFDSGAAISGIQAAKYIETASYFQLRKTIDKTISDVKTNFFQVILNRALIIAQEQSVALLESQLQDQINRFEAGTVPRFNVLQAEVALANAIPPLIEARNNLRISQYQLVRLLGMNYDHSNLVQVPFDVTGSLDFTYRKINTEESVRTALIQNPELKAIRQDILTQAAQVNVALAGYGPKVTANAGYEWQNDPAFRDLGQILNGWFFGLQGSWALFDGFLTAGNVQQAKARLMQSKISYDNAVRTVILTVQEAISNLQQARETIDSQQASVAQATEALRLSRERLDAGAGTQLDVLNAQVALLQAQTTLLQARYSYIAALAQYDAALSLDTKWEEAFNDPLAAPEKRKFIKVNLPDAPQPKLPRVFRGEDPLSGVIKPDGKPAVKSGDKPENKKAPAKIKPAPTPKPTPKPTPTSKTKAATGN